MSKSYIKDVNSNYLNICLMEDVIKKVADLAKEKSWHEIMETYILPEVLKKGGSARGYKISDDFMSFVAEYVVFNTILRII